MKIKKISLIKIAAISFLLTIFWSASAFAQPLITSFSGSLTDGSTITINGSSFGVNGPNVVLFDDFEKGNGAIGAVIPLTSPEIGQWTQYGQDLGRPHYHAVANSGTHSWSIRDWNYSAANGSNIIGQFWQVFNSPITEFFVSYQVAVPTNGTYPGYFPGASTAGTFPSVSSWKFVWLFDGPTGYYSDGKADMCLPTHAGYGSFYFAGNDGNIVSFPTNSWWSWKGFNRFSVWLRGAATNPSVNNGNILFQVVNAEKGMTSYSYNDRPVFPAGSTTQWSQMTMPGWWGNGDWSKFDGVYDDVYVATGPNAAARVEIGDAATYTTSKNLTIATVTSWSDTSITATIRQGSFSNLNNAYLYVIDADGNVNENGYLLSDGGGGNTPPTSSGSGGDSSSSGGSGCGFVKDDGK